MSEEFLKIDLHGLTQEEAIPIIDKAIRELELAVGKEAYAVIKATSVMIGVDD